MANIYTKAENIKHTDLPRVIVGGMQIGPEDPDPSALITVSYQSEKAAFGYAAHLSSIQNGIRPFSSGPDVFAGDTVIRIHIDRRPSLENMYLCRVTAKTNPAHLTYAFHAASYVGKAEIDAFYDLYDLSNHFIFTISHAGVPLLDSLNLIKYTIDRKGA